MIWLFSLVRAIFASCFFIVWTALHSVLVLLSVALFSRKTTDKVVYTWCAPSLFVFGVSVEAVGIENIPRDRGVLFLFNHQSYFDIPAVHTLLPNIRFGAKIELFRIPIFGRAMLAAGALPIARENRADVFRVYEAAAKRFSQGESFVLAPESTRQSHAKIGKFKKGPFVFALKADAPIVPAVVVGAYEVLSKNAVLGNLGKMKRKIRIHFLPVVEMKGHENDLQDVVDRVQQQMTECFDREHAKLLIEQQERA